MGVPVAATDVSALPELARNGDTALTCPPDDPAALAAAVRRLLEDAALRGRLIAAAKAAVARDFDNLANTRALAEVFARHAGRPAGAFAAGLAAAGPAPGASDAAP